MKQKQTKILGWLMIFVWLALPIIGQAQDAAAPDELQEKLKAQGH